MRIGLVLPGFSASERDWCIPALYNFVRTLARQNQVTVFALEYPYFRQRYGFFDATVHSLNGNHRGKLYAPRLWSAALAAIFAEHRRARFDVLHAFWVNEAGLIALVAARLLHVPMVASVAGGELVEVASAGYGGQRHRVEKTIVNWVLKRADRVTVGSRYLQKLAARWRDDAQIAPLGVDTRIFSPQGAGASRAPTRIVNVASLVRVKRQEILLEAFARLRSDAQLEIVGAGERQKFLRTRACDLGISNRVTFAGQVAHDQLPQKYHEADAFVQSSVHEAQGLAPLEAAACGLAIAGTPVGILPELAEQRAGVVSDEFSARSLAQAIECAIETQQSLGCRAREIVEREFSLEAANARWINLYTSPI